MSDNLTEIVIVLDRSGSMNACKKDMEGGLNEFIRSQAEFPGEAVLTLVQFDTEYEFIHRSSPIKSVGYIPLLPRGMTALLDAVGRAISEVKESRSGLADEKRPDKTVVMVVTDGRENASKEYTREQVKKLVIEQQNAGWQFVFLGAEIDAFAEAGGMGIKEQTTGGFAKTQAGIAGMYSATGQNVAEYRAGMRQDLSYTKKQRDDMV